VVAGGVPVALANSKSLGTGQRQQHEHMIHELQQRHNQQQQQQQQLYSQPSSIDPALLQQLLLKMQEMEQGLCVNAALVVFFPRLTTNSQSFGAPQAGRDGRGANVICHWCWCCLLLQLIMLV
jgi:hypothetical protein